MSSYSEMANRFFRNVYAKTPTYDPVWGEANEASYPPPVQQKPVFLNSLTHHKEEHTPTHAEAHPLLPSNYLY